MDVLKNALDYASLGWKLFPAKWVDGTHKGHIKWGVGSSSDPDTIREWAKKWPDAYFCVAAHLSDITILDVDNKNGKTGSETLKGLENDHEKLPRTLQSKTPSGGHHFFFVGKSAVTVQRIGCGLDSPVMVPIPGTHIPEKGKYAVENKVRPVGVPGWLHISLGEARERDSRHDEPIGKLDLDHNVSAAREYLVNCPPALQGEGGNDYTYRTACLIRDYGVSRETALDIMLEYWYPRCEPNNKPEFVERLVGNAYEYALNRPGTKTPEALFPDPLRSTDVIRCASDIKLADIEPREWLLGYRYIKGYVTVTIAPGGVGKSTLTIVEGLALASGKKLTYDAVKTRGAVWLYNTEDPFDELDRRILAAIKHHNLTSKDTKDFYYSSGRAQPLKLVAESSGGLIVAGHIVESIIKAIKKRDIKLFIVDPFIRCHDANENDNKAVDLVVQQFTRIAEETGCAVSLVHHTKKGKETRGDMDAGRGASALVSAARIAHTLYNMNDKECGKFGIPWGRRKWYCRLDDAKANLSPPCNNTAWFEKLSIDLMDNNDETTGILVPVELDEVTLDSVDDTIRDCVLGMLKPGESRSLYSLAAEIEATGVFDIGVKTIRSKIEREFAKPVNTSYGTFRLKDISGGGGKLVKHLVCTEMF